MTPLNCGALLTPWHENIEDTTEALKRHRYFPGQMVFTFMLSYPAAIKERITPKTEAKRQKFRPLSYPYQRHEIKMLAKALLELERQRTPYALVETDDGLEIWRHPQNWTSGSTELDAEDLHLIRKLRA